MKDIIIIGGGASGMMAAVKAKENNPDKSVLLVEKQNRIGRKLLSTGNGRCNLTNLNAEKSRYHGSFRKYMDTVLNRCSANDVIGEFERMGLRVKAEGDGRVYPLSNHAASVLDVLRFRLNKLGVETLCDTAVKDIKKNKKGFSVITDKESLECKKLIIATGSCASPKLGSDKSGLSILEKLGIKTVPFSPVLCPVKVKSDYIASLKGVRVSGSASLYDGYKLVKSEFGEIQFTEDSLSGICVFNLSSTLNKTKKPEIRLDLMPDYSFNDTLNILISNKEIFNDRAVEDLLTGIFNKKLGLVLLKASGIKPLSREISSLTQSELKRLTSVIKAFSFKPTMQNDFGNAQAASGGVIGTELDPQTMESLRIRGLYIIGECVDIDGDCGGFNLQFAFASGIIAGESV